MDSLDDVIPMQRVDRVDSTMKLARREIESGVLTQEQWAAPVGRFYVAKEQTGGFGRQGRAWHSPPGGLWCTLAWPLVQATPTAPVVNGLGLRVGVAVMRVIGETLTRNYSGMAPMLKWPNDILINGKKAAGSLCETCSSPVPTDGSGETPVTWLLIGVGVNVNNDASQLPGDLRRAAVALRECVPHELDLEELARSMRAALHGAAIGAGVDAETLKIARDRLFKGRNLNLVAPGGFVMPGELIGLDDQGLPIVRSGDATFVVPPGSEFV